MRDVPNAARYKVAVSPWHLVSLEAHFHRQKAASKPLKDAFYATFGCEIKKLPWYDPTPDLRASYSQSADS